MTADQINGITKWVVVGPFILWALWEIALLALRSRGLDVRLISGEATRLAYRGLPTLAYAMAGLTAHFFLTWARIPWSEPVAAVLGGIWWAVLAAYLVADWLDPDHAYWPPVTQYLRHPTTAALVGGIGAWLMFPQRSLWTPGGSP